MSNPSLGAAGFAWLALCFLGTVLSLQSLAVLRARSPWTSLGWFFSALYFVLAGLKVARSWSVPFHAEYWCLALLTLAFVLAGIRDERQAEPWWWPNRAGPTGRERRASR